MLKSETKNHTDKKEPSIMVKNVCSFSYLSEIMNGKKELIMKIMDVFLKDALVDLQSMNEAINGKEFLLIKNLAHKMKSSVSMMGISILEPLLSELESLGEKSGDIGRINELNQQLVSICHQAFEEIKEEKQKLLNSPS